MSADSRERSLVSPYNGPKGSAKHTPCSQILLEIRDVKMCEFVRSLRTKSLFSRGLVLVELEFEPPALSQLRILILNREQPWPTPFKVIPQFGSQRCHYITIRLPPPLSLFFT